MKKWNLSPEKIVFILTAVIFAVLLPVLSLDSGNSGDEDPFQIPQGRNIVNYFKTGGQDTTCLDFKGNLQYYGSSFDVVMTVFNDTFHVDNIHTTRHIFNSLFGWMAILFVGLIACKIAGHRAGIITMFLMFFSPRFLGHSFNNPKDVPFAAGVIAAIYFMMLFFEKFPKISIKAVIGLVLSIALAISIRIGGIMLFGYFGVFGLAYLIKVYYEKRSNLKVLKPKKRKPLLEGRFVMKLFLWGVGIAIVGFFLGIVLWPYALQSPIKNSITAFKEMSDFSLSIRQVFQGEDIWSSELPWYYTVKFILITIPIAVILGNILYLFLGAFKKQNRFSTFIVYFAFLFPVIWITITNANVYGGWRHSMFVYPPMVIGAGLGFNALIDVVKNKWAKIGLTALPFILLIPPVIHIIKNHPYEYLYFNEFTGGVKGAYGKYEIDYYYNSTREASEWLSANARKTGLETGSKIKVASWHPESVSYFLRKDTAKFDVLFCRWNERGNSDWDYAVFVLTGMEPELLLNTKFFPPANTVHQVKVEGKPICIILKRTDKSDYYGKELMKEQKLDSAKILFEKSLQVVPTNESVLYSMAEIYVAKNQLDSAKFYIDRILAFNPKQDHANNMLAYIYFLQKKDDEALKVCRKMMLENPYDKYSYKLSADIYIRQGNLLKAEKELMKGVYVGVMDEGILDKLFLIYRHQGHSERSARAKQYKVISEGYEREGNTEKAEEYRDAVKRLSKPF